MKKVMIALLCCQLQGCVLLHFARHAHTATPPSTGQSVLTAIKNCGTKCDPIK